MTSLTVRADLRCSAAKIVFDYLNSDGTDHLQEEKEKIQALVAQIFTGKQSSSMIIYLPLPGKPNPELPLDLMHPRPRVVRQGQQEVTDIYSAMQMIRLRIGKNSAEEWKAMREVEKSISLWRKNYARTATIHSEHLQFSREVVPGYGQVTQSNVTELLQKINKLIKPENVGITRFLLKKFKQSKHHFFSDFVMDISAKALRRDILDYMSSNAISLDSLFSKEWRWRWPSKENWQSLNINDKAHFLFYCVFQVAYKKYGLKDSLWNPENPIQNLSKQIEAHGPHVITGKFGRDCYKQDPFPTSLKIQERVVYGWHPHTNRVDDAPNRAIVLVGVNCTNNYVYFLDPIEPSDPKRPNQEKIYVVSYENIRRNINTLSGLKFRELTGEPKFFPEFPYAIHGDPELARL